MPNKFITEFNAESGAVKTAYYPANKDSVAVRISQGDNVITLNPTEILYLTQSLEAIKNVAPSMKDNEDNSPIKLTGKPSKAGWGLDGLG